MENTFQNNETMEDALRFFRDLAGPPIDDECSELAPQKNFSKDKVRSNFEKFISLTWRLDVDKEILDEMFADLEFINSSPTFLDSPFLKLIEHCNSLMSEFRETDGKYSCHTWSEFSELEHPNLDDKEVIALKSDIESGRSEIKMEKILLDLQNNILKALYSCFYERETIYRNDFVAREHAEKNERDSKMKRLN